MKATSQPNPTHVIMIFGVMGIMFTFLGTFLIFMVAPEYPISKQIGLTLVGSMFYVTTLLAMVSYFRSVPKIIVNLDGIQIRHIHKLEIIDVKNITSVSLHQKSPYKLLMIEWPIESTIVHLKDGSSRIFYDSMYEGFGFIKYGLELLIDPDREAKIKEIRKKKVQIKPVEPNEINIEYFKVFKGTGFINFYGLIFIGSLLFFVFTVDTENLFRIFIFLPIVAGLIGYNLNYFRVSDNFFQVRNMIWFWKKKSYRLIDIQEIIFEQPFNAPNALRVRLKNYRTSHLQLAGSFSDKHWQELSEELERLNIPVREK